MAENKLKKQNLFFMGIKDKHVLSGEKICPPHYFPHKIPIGKKVDNETCHVHKAKWRMAHHALFCRMLNCKNYTFMIMQHKKKLKDIRKV